MWKILMLLEPIMPCEINARSHRFLGLSNKLVRQHVPRLDSLLRPPVYFQVRGFSTTQAGIRLVPQSIWGQGSALWGPAWSCD